MSSPSVAEPAGQSGTQSRLHALTIPQALKRWLREPLVHFLLIGAALFAIYAYLHRGRMGIESSHQIVVSLDELRQMDLYFVSQWHRQPTVEEFNAMVEEFGYANYEMIPSPQFVLNPLNAALNLFSIDLGLNAEQKQQVVPIIQQKIPKLEALKKNTSLKPVDKLEQLKQIADELDSKIMPLLNADQQKKFQEIREVHRRQLIEKIGGKLVQKAETSAALFFDQHAQSKK